VRTALRCRGSALFTATRSLMTVVAMATTVATTTAAAADTAAALAHTAAVSVLPGSGHSWGFAAKDPTRPWLFIARRDNGLTVFNTDTQ